MTTVLIAAAEYLGPLKERGEFTDALAFADTDALRALESITRQRPRVVALERMFAATSRGNALINRIKADPALGGCEIQIVSHERTAPPPAPPSRSTPPAPSPLTVEAPAPSTTSAAPAVAPLSEPAPAPAAVPAEPAVIAPPALDENGTRWAPRFEIVDGVELFVDGQPATIIDLSVSGAQIVSQTSLRPNQRVRVSLPSLTSLRLVGLIAWAQFEMPSSGPRYRAGIRFQDPDTGAIDAFLLKHRK